MNLKTILCLLTFKLTAMLSGFVTRSKGPLHFGCDRLLCTSGDIGIKPPQTTLN